MRSRVCWPREASRSGGVVGGGGGVGASGGSVPDQDARFGLFEPPAVGLLAPMVVTAQRTVPALAYTAVELGKRLCGYDFSRDAGRREAVPEDCGSTVS